MKYELARKLIDELFPHLEKMETQCTAMLQFMKDKGLATDKQLAPYLERAGNASNVKWRASRLRIEHVLSQIQHDLEKSHEAKPAPPPQPEEKTDAGKEMERDTKPAEAVEQGKKRQPKEAA